MNNNFFAYVKNSSGSYERIDGKAVVPFSYGELLDERLDEAYLHLILSDTEIYEPLTEIKIELYQDNVLKDTKYYVVASDRSQRSPMNSNKYKHEIFLLERTKLLEGIYCSSLTFTNPMGNIYTNNSFSALDSVEHTSAATTVNKSQEIKNRARNFYVSPAALGEDFEIKSANELGKFLEEDNFEFYSGSAIYESDNESFTLTEAENAKIVMSTSVIVKYSLKFETIMLNDNGLATSSYSTYDIIFIISGVQNQYPLKPWTITDCVNRCLDLAEPIFEGEAPRYTFAPSQAKKYANILAPEFTMTQCTLREQLKVIGSFIHAEPRLGGYDENGVYQENWIFFDEYGIGEKAKIADKSYIYEGFTHDINEYCTHIETSASNLVNALNYAQGVVTEPNINNNRTLRTESINVMLSESNSYAKTDNAIYDIPNKKGGVLVTLYKADGSSVFENVDITPYIFTETEYNNLSSFSGGYPYTKHYALYYTRGQKGIKGLFYKIENAYSELFSNYAIVNILKAVTGVDYKDEITEGFERLAFRITYVPIYDTKFSHSKQTVKLGKKPYAKIYNQSENLIETRYYGENIKGVAQRLGNVEREITYILGDMADVPKVGQTIDGYFVVEVKTEIQYGSIKCTVQLSKDFNRISQYVGISSVKRVYEVSEANTYARDILLKNYVVVGDSTDTVTPSSEGAVLETITPIMQIFNPSITGKIDAPINAVRAYGLTKNLNEIGDVMLPVISSAFGNTMVFSWDYKDNYSAGEKASNITYQNEKEDDVSATWQCDIPYGDYYGRAWWYGFEMFSNLDMIEADGTSHEYEQAQTVANKIPSDMNKSNIKTPGYLLLRKDSRERLSFNYEVEFVTTHDDIIIGSALASSCPLVSGKTYSGIPQVIFYDEEINKFSKTLPKVIGGVNISTTIENGVLTVSFSIPIQAQCTFKSWAIVSPATFESGTYEDEDGKLDTLKIERGGELLIGRNKSVTDYASENKTTETITFQIAKTIYDR